MAKTYVPGLRTEAEDFRNYASRWFVKLDITLDDAAMAKLSAALDAIDELLIELGPPIYNP